MLHGEQRGLFDLDLCLPSECADRLETGEADVGIVPSVELPRLGLEMIRGAGIACREAVRSILLVSKVPFRDIRVLAADTSSRTSVQLVRILLARNHGVQPRIVPRPPDLPAML
jgi:predicted solute-binding protein